MLCTRMYSLVHEQFLQLNFIIIPPDIYNNKRTRYIWKSPGKLHFNGMRDVGTLGYFVQIYGYGMLLWLSSDDATKKFSQF